MTNLRIIHHVAALGMLAALASGCGGAATNPSATNGSGAAAKASGGANASADAAGEACGLFAVAEVSAAIGHTMMKASGAPRGLLAESVCIWTGSELGSMLEIGPT